jgi:hypothetical protein
MRIYEIKEYADVGDLEAGLNSNFGFYNEERPHQRLGNRRPSEVHFGL